MKHALNVIFLSLLSGCSNLKAVRDISSRLSVASTTWDEVGSDVAASCGRQMMINSAMPDCDLEKKASAGLNSANAILADYFKALMNAATETNFTVQPGLDKATASVSAIPGINKDQVDAVSGLFGLLAKLGTDKMREDTLRDLITDGTPRARTVIAGMDAIVVPALSLQLDTEKLQLTGFFGRQILAQKDALGPDPAGLCVGSTASSFSSTGYLLVLEYCRRLAVVDKRAKALAGYRASLTVADKAMQELQSSKTKLKAKEVAQRLYLIGAELDESIAAVRKAFG